MKRLNEQGFHLWLIPLILIIVIVLGFAGWYVWDKNKDDNNTAETTQDDAVTSSQTATTPTSTPTTEPVADTQNELDTLRIFCQGTDPDILVGSLQYVENQYGSFGNCNMSHESGGGWMLIAALTDNVWVEVYEGNGIMDSNLCAQYKLPFDIYEDCPGYYE